MSSIDWILMALPIVIVVAVAFYTNRFVKSVADFLSGGRCAGRYLLANARGESDAGLSNTMSKFEQIMVSGFILGFWDKLTVPIYLLVGISGFIYYRYRETRAMTLAQFLEMRYSRNYRLFMGILAFVSGILNYGIFPAVSARFFIYFLDLPSHFSLLGISISTFATLMATYLTFTVLLVFFGGQATAMVVDCIEGITSHLIYVVIALALFHHIGLDRMMDHISHRPPKQSMINPFDTDKVEDFNLQFVAMSVFLTIYKRMAVQNKQGFNSAARTPHDARMADVLGHWRGYARNLMLAVLVISALTFLGHQEYAQEAQQANAVIKAIPDTYIQKQMQIPIALRFLLPIGVKGLFCAVMVMGLFAGDSGHIHSWSSIFIQDVVLPLRKTPMTPVQHIRTLRLAVILVASFAFFFSLVFTQTQYITLWWNLTEAIFVGGAGSAIIGGLYWRRGTTQAAWSASIVGSVLSLIVIVCSNKTTWAWLVDYAAQHGHALPAKFWLNGTQTAFAAALISITIYVTVSLLTSRELFDLDRMLHRGEYSDDPTKKTASVKKQFSLKAILKFDQNFTFWNKMVSGGVFWWTMVLLAINLTTTVLNIRQWKPDWTFLPEPWSIQAWQTFWKIFGIYIPLVLAIVTLVWFGIGGAVDMKRFFHDLRSMKRNAHDDGRVEIHDEKGRPIATGEKRE